MKSVFEVPWLKEDKSCYRSNQNHVDQDHAVTKQPPVHQPHDSGYKYLLSVKEIFIELLRSVIKQEWVKQIDASSLVKVDKSYILPDFRKRESDLVYRVKFKDLDVIFYVLLELQSTADHQMPVRLLFYQIEILRDIIRNTPKNKWDNNFKLPAIIPIVLYNGTNRWTVKQQFREVLAGASMFGDYLLDFQYMLIDVNRLDESDLLQMKNLIGSVFYLDQVRDTKQFLNRWSKLFQHLNALNESDLRKFYHWVERIFLQRFPKEHRTEHWNTLKKGITEANPAMLTNFERMLDKYIEEKLEEGKLKGRLEGRLEGETAGKMKVAKELLKRGMSLSEVAEITELDPEKIKSALQ